ncbi:hypothetical protein [Dongia deserti]|uniref:hypothetical protein n=1 Tax=Dongia deserti TaxID=2268030 RepID=UPI000E64EEF5|nr:hypothetical protein [Dongia deserti]
MTQRLEAVTQTTDTLSYDGLNRLTQAVTSNPSLPLNLTKTITYDAIGNISAKSDVGTYSYDPMRVHAVASIAPGATGTVTASYTYDANGNMLTGRGRTVSWTSFDMVSEIAQGTTSVASTYDSEHARLTQVSSTAPPTRTIQRPVSSKNHGSSMTSMDDRGTERIILITDTRKTMTFPIPTRGNMGLGTVRKAKRQ